MAQADSQRTVKRWVMVGALVTIAIGVFIALTVGWYGWVIAGVGVIDLAAAPLWIGRMGTVGKQTEPVISTGDEGSAPAGTSAEPTADPAYNPYARED